MAERAIEFVAHLCFFAAQVVQSKLLQSHDGLSSAQLINALNADCNEFSRAATPIVVTLAILALSGIFAMMAAIGMSTPCVARRSTFTSVLRVVCSWDYYPRVCQNRDVFVVSARHMICHFCYVIMYSRF